MKTPWEIQAEVAAQNLADEFLEMPARPLLSAMLKIAYMQGACNGLPAMPKKWVDGLVARLTQEALTRELSGD